MENIINNIMKSNYIYLNKIDNLNGGYFFCASTSRKLFGESHTIGNRGYDIIRQARIEGRDIDITYDKEGHDIVYVIRKI